MSGARKRPVSARPRTFRQVVLWQICHRSPICCSLSLTAMKIGTLHGIIPMISQISKLKRSVRAQHVPLPLMGTVRGVRLPGLNVNTPYGGFAVIVSCCDLFYAESEAWRTRTDDSVANTSRSSAMKVLSRFRHTGGPDTTHSSNPLLLS